MSSNYFTKAYPVPISIDSTTPVTLRSKLDLPYDCAFSVGMVVSKVLAGSVDKCIKRDGFSSQPQAVPSI